MKENSQEDKIDLSRKSRKETKLIRERERERWGGGGEREMGWGRKRKT